MDVQARGLHPVRKMKFAIRNVKTRVDVERATYDSLEHARTALREALGWPEVQLGPGYTTSNTASQIWRAYRTSADLTWIGRHPRMSPMIHGDIRARLVLGYQYRIFYIIDGPDIEIRSVRSTRRLRPWEDRSR